MNNEAMTTELLPDMRAADAKLAADLTRIFSDLALIPEQVITGIHSSGYAENGDFLLMLDLADGAMMFLSITPGEPLKIVVQQN